MKLYRIELDKGISKKLFDIDTNQFQSGELSFYENVIKGELSAERSLNGYHINGTINIPFEQTCDRCLTVFHDLKNVNFNFWFTEDAKLLQDDTDDVLFFSKDENEIDLKTLLREVILLEEQIKSLCSQNCKGLCSNCGSNLNEGNCMCSIEIKNSPWEVLKKFKGTA